MMTNRTIGLLAPMALALLASACNSTEPAPAGNQAAAAAPKPGGFAAKVVALSEGQRQGVMLRAIRDAGHQCQGVAGTRRQPQGVNGLPAWAATCEDGSNWLVSFGDDGMARVTGLPAR
ncbi:hypothetical protein D9601_06860 [Sphingomonas sp. MA1305]|uniref:hypothetical protein n=1 Tax=Sphingomonas sp. MA1305 TaxID=2479204 RepID=UPI0018E02B38|nr:hypothetical protein [Sphingomonas sp. MA1305]MBI0475078.1 hypothetical protein [Sphingomonas sp. MA1305]